MGMMIADNIDFLNEAKKFYEEIANNPSLNETIKTYFTIESLESAINIMRKYQKIRLIINKWNAGIYDDEGLCDVEVLEKIDAIIDEVIEDGNET